LSGRQFSLVVTRWSRST